MVLVEAGVEQPVAVRVAGQEVHGAAESTAPQRRMPLGRSTAGIGLASADAAAGSERPTACARSGSRRSARQSTHGLPGGEERRASRLRGRGRVTERRVDSAGAGPDLRGEVASLERGAKGGNHLTGVRCPSNLRSRQDPDSHTNSSPPPLRKSYKWERDFLILIDKKDRKLSQYK